MKNTKQQWSLILGGSSGMGLAAAKKLAQHGHALIIVHRDRKSAMKTIEPEFKKIRETAAALITINKNALDDDCRQGILSEIADKIQDGQINFLLHSIALGNLRKIAPDIQQKPTQHLEVLATKLGISANELTTAIQDLSTSHPVWDNMLDKPPLERASDNLLNAEDFSQTIAYMGFDILLWVQDIFRRGMFAADSRVIGLTSEGNTKAWDGYAAVAAAKSTLESVSRAIAKEFAPHGIRSNIIQAGITDTPALRLIPGHRSMIASAVQRNPLSRLTTPEDVANAIYLLSLPEAHWINGALLHVDGGEHIV